ncbi:Uncharacterised protein [Acinetobacter baumannii]|uniref:KTSC domain-containing protein n=1 Tax=Acinetobacter baumannii TaxID=470 RepID=UPI0008199C0C|nr:KTSC domain-containing protein [Acinetobacter baumannii]SCD14940.1 Uncharacterised protein [Acinetobacter baumannii]
MQQFQINSELIEAVTYDASSYSLYIHFVDRGVIAFQLISANDVNAFLASQDKDIFLKESLMLNSQFRKSIQTRSSIAKSLFQD